MMINSLKLKLLAVTISSMLFTGCGDAETTLVEKDPIEASEDEHDHGDDDEHSDDITIDSLGRLAVSENASNMLHMFDLDDNTVLDSISTTFSGSALTASADYRYATVTTRSEGLVQFVDGGLWREDHGAHLHDYKQDPVLSTYELTGSRPTHVISHDGQLAVFNDGDADSATPASVHVVTDTIIAAETAPRELSFTTNMHGVAEPRGEHLLATMRRDDVESTSSTKILPDQVGVFHLHDGEYELDKTLDESCPDLHGAAQNHDSVVFGCSDGLLVAHQHDDDYDAVKIANIDELNGLRVGTLYGHENSESFIGIASGHGGGTATLVSVDVDKNEMQALEWQPDASPVSYAFSHDGELFLVLDEQGFLNILSAHEHDGHTEWELVTQIDITEEDLADMPEGMSFSMTVAQNEHFVYVADPIAQHVLQIHLEDMEIEGDIELGFSPASITWLGIAGSEHTHD
jgi:hypothetical protein